MLRRARTLTPIIVALTLGSFSVYLVAKGEIEAAMGGAGAAIASATMRNNEDSEEDIEMRIRNELKIQALESELKIQILEVEAKNRKYLESQEKENMYLRFQLETKEKEAMLLLKEQELEHQKALLLKEQEVTDPKSLPESEVDISKDLNENSS
jgi:hypothetical protein